MKHLLILIALVIAGCVSVPKLPDTDQQLAQFSRQNFSPAYQVAITSYFNDAKVLVDVSRQKVRFVENQREANRIALQEKSDRDDLAIDFSTSSGIYNRGENVSAIESRFGNALKENLAITPTYYSRKRIHKMLEGEMLKTSAMMHAKKLATQDGTNAVLVVYLTPILVQADSVVGKEYRFQYDTQVAMRAIAEDKLIYNKIKTYPCSTNLPSLAWKISEESHKTMASCEREIHQKMIEDFLAFSRQAGK